MAYMKLKNSIIDNLSLVGDTVWALDKLLDIVEECYPKYYSCDIIAEINDIRKRYDDYIVDPEKIIGYQIEDKEGKHESPYEYSSFAILSKKAVDNFFKAVSKADAAIWKVVPIHEGDIEEPTFIEE